MDEPTITSPGEVKIDDAHVSKHAREGKEGTHIISQPAHSEGKTKIAYTDVDDKGNVGKSGFDKRI